MANVKRFVRFQTSAARQARVNSIPEGVRRHNEVEAQKIFDTAERLLAAVKPDTHLIIPADHMRTLFYAVRGLNEITRTLPRRYISHPRTSIPHIAIKSGEEMQKELERVRKEIGPIPKKSPARFVLVEDTYNYNRNVPRLLSKEIKWALTRVNPKATLTAVSKQAIIDTRVTRDGYSKYLGAGIKSAVFFGAPTSSGEETVPITDHYSQFQELLQKWLDSKRAEYRTQASKHG